MRIQKNELVRLLTAVQRKAYVAGKVRPQVHSCIIRTHADMFKRHSVCVVSLVRDGKTSVSHFAAKGEMGGDEGAFVIPDIEMMLGVLKAHGDEVTLAWVGHNKIRIGSKITSKRLKRTTLTANGKALSFPTSQETVEEWEEKSSERAGQIIPDSNAYMTSKGEKIEGLVVDLESPLLLKEALRSSSINGQKLGRVRFTADGGELEVIVGDSLKGQTSSFVGYTTQDFDFTIEGGWEFVIDNFNDDMVLTIFDFSEFGQGFAVLLSQREGDSWLFQRGVV